MSDLALVFSTFDPLPSLCDTVRRFTSEHPIIIVDDGGRDPHGVLPQLSALGAQVIRHDDNSGIAAALNSGMEAAFAGGATMVVTFDQDSTPSRDTIEMLRVTLEHAMSEGIRVAGIVPAEFAQVRQSRSREALATASRVIQSGMLIPRAAFDALGRFDESLFIDLVDTDYEMRALAHGFRIVAAPTRIDHELGRSVSLAPLAPLPPRIRTMVSTPFRYYYRARNRLVLTRRFVRTAPARMTIDLLIDLAYFALIVASSRPRRAMLAIICRGFLDAFKGRSGRAPEGIAAAADRITWSTAKDSR